MNPSKAAFDCDTEKEIVSLVNAICIKFDMVSKRVALGFGSIPI